MTSLLLREPILRLAVTGGNGLPQNAFGGFVRDALMGSRLARRRPGMPSRMILSRHGLALAREWVRHEAERAGLKVKFR